MRGSTDGEYFLLESVVRISRDWCLFSLEVCVMRSSGKVLRQIWESEKGGWWGSRVRGLPAGECLLLERVVGGSGVGDGGAALALF